MSLLGAGLGPINTLFPPQLFAFLGFLTSALWINAAATEVVNILRSLGVVFRLSNTVLGLTLLAWGNSIGGDSGRVGFWEEHGLITVLMAPPARMACGQGHPGHLPSVCAQCHCRFGVTITGHWGEMAWTSPGPGDYVEAPASSPLSNVWTPSGSPEFRQDMEPIAANDANVSMGV